MVIRPRRVIHDVLPVYPVLPPPGRTLNPVLIGWYYQQAFSDDYEQDEMSKLYPWLFGPQGLYGGMHVPKCDYPCEMKNGVCECPS